ncbi:MAG: hypothetical protein ACRBCS_13850 [Cellvibrionaceae bacterium]
MNTNQYEVVYLDKFTNAVEAKTASKKLQQTFGLAESHIEKMSSGEPVVIKKQVDLEEANRYQEAVKKAGGVAWIQEVGEDGFHQERRKGARRVTLDRRAVYRASSILPDRRGSCGRRSTDQLTLH